MRLDICDDEERPGQFALWQANCQRSLNGKVGQRELRELEAALLALPEKRLIHGRLWHDGGVCAIGAYAQHKGVDIRNVDPEDNSDQVGIQAGMPRLVAWTVVALNDINFKINYTLGRSGMPYTPEERYESVLTWVRQHIRTETT